MRVCVLEGGRLREIVAIYNTATGDLTYEGRPVAEALPDTLTYLAGKSWYVENEPITWENRRFTRFGIARRLSADDLRLVGEHDGVMLFTDTPHPREPEVLYLPTRPGCEFQPYQWDLVTGGIRGR